MERHAPSKKRKKSAPSASLGPDAWVAAARHVLARLGVEGVRVEPLAAQLGVTKGSFYWHFRDRAALLDALLDDWEQRATQGVIAFVDASAESPRARLTELLRVTTTAQEAPDVEHAIRAWGTQDAGVRDRLARIDRNRERYVADLLASAGVERKAAAHRARALYLALIGEYTRVAHGGPPTNRAMWTEVLDLVLADTTAAERPPFPSGPPGPVRG